MHETSKAYSHRSGRKMNEVEQKQLVIPGHEQHCQRCVSGTNREEQAEPAMDYDGTGCESHRNQERYRRDKDLHSVAIASEERRSECFRAGEEAASDRQKHPAGISIRRYHRVLGEAAWSNQ